MSYNKSIEDRITQLKLRQSRRTTFSEWLLVSALVIILLFVVYYLFFTMLSPLISSTVTAVLTIFFVLGIVGFIGYTGLIAKKTWQNKEYLVTPDKVVVFEGILNKKKKTTSLKGYTSMRFDQPPHKKIFNSGNITLFFMGGGSVVLENIHDVQTAVEMIEQLIEKGYIE